MAACGSLQHIFENKLLPENPTLIESLSWNQIKPVVVNPLEHQQHSFTEIFGELHFKETTLISSSSNYTKLNQNNSEDFGESRNNKSRRHKSSDSFSSWSSESHAAAQVSEEYNDCYGGGGGEHWRRSSRMSSGGGNSYPPPISSIGRSGKPGVLFRSFRSNGRFVLEEIRVPSQEFLHASREDGRLKLHFIHPDDDDDDEFLEEEEEEDDVDEEQEEEEE
ncbi:uncharacterized protein LOC127744228 [Arachis duranensis]|uniref:Uncharacterized protein LOC107461841 n=1 Tax=Arachis duranensis TaxID=130453 RepID=A0A6P4B985_ARADU|nr:uncharacterized protein LOC107461841 [Arachis duranensis]XP_052112467.1 uncharacterized protein LOC127744228 [Arachis duranensis]